MRVAFMGTPEFSVPALSALIEAGHEIACVYSQPPRPAGRGHKKRPSPIQELAESLDLDARQPSSLGEKTVQAEFLSLNADVAVVVAYGLILPKPILSGPRLGCLNIHASLLPRWRGAAPIQRAILAGESETGITIMQIDDGLDTGPILAVERVPITKKTTASNLHDELANIGARLIVEVLSNDLPSPVSQPEEGVTYAQKLDRAEGRIDWTRTSSEIDRRVRALNPWPGVWCELNSERLQILSVKPVNGSGVPGTVIAEPLIVACGEGALQIDQVQRAGRSKMPTADFVRGYPVPIGTVFS
ncbi:MAG: methionyl-tRNA formyltransferase [Alphaproteobacteria bacterium]|nr:methionyl-tRNA formyltransferase [Alphaproteobacteria bacterium]